MADARAGSGEGLGGEHASAMVVRWHFESCTPTCCLPTQEGRIQTIGDPIQALDSWKQTVEPDLL